MTTLTKDRIELLDGDYVLVDRMLIDEAASCLKQHDDPAVRKQGEKLHAALHTTILGVANEQRAHYLKLREHYRSMGITWRLPEALLMEKL